MYHIYDYYLRKLYKSCSKLKKKEDRNEMQKTEYDRKERIFLLVKKQKNRFFMPSIIERV